MIRLSALQEGILSALADNTLGTQKEIAEATGSYQSSISRSIRKLIETGLITCEETGYKITPDGLELLSERMAEGKISQTIPSREAIHIPLAELQQVQERLAALQKPVNDILQVYSRMRPLFEELETTGSLVTSLAHWQTDLAEQFRLVALPSIAIRLAESADVNQQLSGTLKELTTGQARIADRLAQIVTRADWINRTWAIGTMLPSAKALETVAQLAARAFKGPQPIVADTLLNIAQISLAHYQRFASDVLAKAGGTRTRQALLPLTEIKLGGRILEEAIAPLKGIPSNIVSQHSLTDATPNFYDIFDREAATILWDPDIFTEEELEAELEGLPSVKIADAALSLVRTRVRCNRRTQLAGWESPFKPTVDTELISAMLPQATVTDESKFHEFTDWLYKYIYESTGALKRLLDHLAEEECQVAFTVKLLHRYYFHELQHGNEREAKKKYRRIGEIFQESIGKSYPEGREDWQALQLLLLDDLNGMLSKWLSRLDRRGLSS